MHWYWSKQKKNRQYNDQNKRKTDNALVLVKTKEEQTIQWAKQKKNRQYNGQRKRIKKKNNDLQNTTQKT